jgi:3,4-dihydroxy-9,10-secoandrosta-1,3,5(10)-triene-9,17-dione 4,5-dioxygenase
MGATGAWGLRGLGYIGIGAPDPAEWLHFGTEICGLMPARILPDARHNEVAVPTLEAEGSAPDGSVYLKMDERQWRIAVHPANEPGLQYLGFELPNPAAVEGLARELDAMGLEVVRGAPELCDARSVDSLAILHDPAGHRIELYCGPIVDREFVSPHAAHFLTGGLGMGHAVLYVPDADAALDFYRRAFGFERRDYMRFGPDMGIHFLGCTPRHHTLALLRVGNLSGLQHLMLEMTSLDDVGRAQDRAMAHEIPITSKLGRHINDKTVSFYMQAPTGFDVEIGWDGVLVGDDWIEHEFAGTGDEWGHHGLDAEAMKPRK